MNAAEHFDWAVGRALQYVEQGDGEKAMASLVSDFGKHDGTARILNQDLMFLFTGEVAIAGARGARRFIEGLPRPVVAEIPGPRPGPVDCLCPGEFPHPERGMQPGAAAAAHSDGLPSWGADDDVPPNAGSAS